MTSPQLQVLLVYIVFTAVATILALAQRWRSKETKGDGVWKKYPAYILMNLAFMFISWLPKDWHVFEVLLAIIGGLAAFELVSHLWPGGRIFVLATILLVIVTAWVDQKGWIIVWLWVFFLMMGMNTLLGPRDDFGKRSLALAVCMIYLPLCLAAFSWVHAEDARGMQAIFVYLTVATNDAMAQITGQLFGSRKLAVHISPSKTIEGAIGGILFAGMMGTALGRVIGWDYFQGIALGLAMGLASLIGDLTASTWKRALNLRNFSSMLGAQGGVLDRFDGLIFAAPIFYLLTTWQ